MKSSWCRNLGESKINDWICLLCYNYDVIVVLKIMLLYFWIIIIDFMFDYLGKLWMLELLYVYI